MLPKDRVSGILLPLFSFRDRHDFGIGDFGALEGFFRWMSAAKQRLLMVLPLLPTAPGDISPYSTRSAFGLNPLFIDLSALSEFKASGGFDGLNPEEKRALEEARKSPKVLYDRVFRVKLAALRRAFDRSNPDDPGFARYRSEQARWLEPFALFVALSEEHRHQPWWEWPEPLRTRQPQAIAEARARLDTEIRYRSWLQWVAETQWNEVRRKARAAGILLCGDEPFIISADSADAWANPEILRMDARLGAPPDAFSATGQDWGLPYFDFQRMEKDDFSWLRYRAKKAASYYDLRRVDHAIGYFRQWIRDAQAPTGRFIPADEPSQQALGERNFRLLSEGAGIVAEDLGVIPNWARETLNRLGLPGYKVMRWEREWDSPGQPFRNPHQFQPLSLVTTGTHDTETMREWWRMLNDHERSLVGQAYPEFGGQLRTHDFAANHEALLAAAENAQSLVCILPWQDVLGTEDRVNLPGSTHEANWTYRIAQNVEELLSVKETREAAERLARLTQAARR